MLPCIRRSDETGQKALAEQLHDRVTVPCAEVALGDYLRYDAGKWELGRYVSAGLAGIGFLLALFPKGR